MTQPKSKSRSRSRSKTPPKRHSSSGALQQNRNGKKYNENHVVFSPISSAPRRGSSASGSSGHGLHHQGRSQNKESLDKERQRRLEKVARARERRERMLKSVRREKKIMLFSSILALVALLLWLVAVFTNHWFYVTQTKEKIEEIRNASLSKDYSKMEVFITSNTGLWKTCAYFQNLKSNEMRVECSFFSIFLTIREEANKDTPNTLNEHVIECNRAQICFASISVLLMTMTIVAAFYTFKNSRYVYKRLAACLYFMTTISVLVVLEVLVTSVYYAQDHDLYPVGAIVKYGFSFYMGWSVFLVYLVNGCIFLIMSRKRKYDKDDDDGTDGGLIMGR